jgi:uncharacterized protein (DUF885 family)
MKKLQGNVILVLFLILLGVWAAGCRTEEATEQPTAGAPAPTTRPSATEQPTSESTVPAPTQQPTVAPAATSPPTPEAVETRSASEKAVAELEGLSLDEFFEESFNQLLLRNPQRLTEMQLSEAFGLRDDRLTDLSDAYIRETQQHETAILEILRLYDRDELNPEQQLSYDVYEYYLDMRVRGHEFMYHDYPLHHFIRSYHFELDQLFTEIHLLNDREDVEDYITRLSQVDEQVEQMLEGVALRQEIGVVPPKFIIELTRSDLMRYLQMRSPDPAGIKAETLPFYTTLSQGIEELELSEAEKQAFRDATLQEIQESVIPGYAKMLDYLDSLMTIATDDAGVWKLPDGDAYYAYMLQQETSTELTPAEIHEIGLAEVTRIQDELRQVFAEMGYSSEATLPELIDHAIDDAGYYNISTQSGKDEFIHAIETVIEKADQAVQDVFDLRPDGEVVVIGGRTGGYYVPGTVDGSRPGAYHVSLMGTWRPKYYIPTVTFHETIPGHHFQIALAQEMDLPTFRNELVFNAYAEGWALYAERLTWELGLYEDDPYGNFGRLMLELLRAARLVTDTGIHALGWTRGQAQQYMDESLGAPGQYTHEVDRYIVLPAQATGYKIGMIKLLELRQRAMDALGDRFDLKEFHNVVLSNGSMPLEILERVVDDYIEAKLKQ